MSFLRILETIGKEIYDANHNEDWKDFDPEKLTEPYTFAARKYVLSKYDMERLYFWAPKGTWRNYPQLHAQLKKELDHKYSQGWGKSLIGEDINTLGVTTKSLLDQYPGTWPKVNAQLNKLKELYTANKEKLARLPNAEYWNFGDHLDKISPLKSKSHSVDDEDALRFVLNNDPNRYTGGADIPAELAIELDMLEETLSKE